MKKICKKSLLVFLTLLMLSMCILPCSAAFVDTTDHIAQRLATDEEIKVNIIGDKINIRRFSTAKLTAEVTGVSEQPKITWSSSDTKVAKVNNKGVVTGLSVGRAFITATAVIDGKTVEGVYSINVVTGRNLVKSLLEYIPLLSYQYSYVDDYYYANDKKSWQAPFGFARIYDLVAPFVAMEYDYARVFFTYDNKDFMIQLWKGQYGYVFYGGEIGVYHKSADGKEPGIFTFYKQADEKYWPNIEMTLYHQNILGQYEREFTRDYDKYWWCTGFKPGHLRMVEPADELRIVSRMTLNDSKMASLFAQGLKDAGFSTATSKDTVGLDQYYIEGKDVYLCWQNLSEAENTVPIKLTAIGLLIANFFALVFAALFMMGLGSIVLLILI